MKFYPTYKMKFIPLFSLCFFLLGLNAFCMGQTELQIEPGVKTNAQDAQKIYHHQLGLQFGFETSKSYSLNGPNSTNLIVPTLGLHYTYWLDEGLGFGFKGNVGLNNYYLQISDTNVIFRNYPFSAIVQIYFNPISGVQLNMGPGIEIEEQQNSFVFNLGLGYKFRLYKQFYATPEVYYQFKGSVIGVYGIEINLGWNFGN